MTETQSVVSRLAEHARTRPHDVSCVKLSATLDIEDSLTFAHLYHKVISLSSRFDVNPGWVLFLFQNSYDFLPYFLAGMHSGTITCSQEVPNSAYKMDKLIGKIERYGIGRVLVQADVFEKKWFQKLLEQVDEPLRSRFTPAPNPHSDLTQLATVFPASSEIAFVQFTSGTTHEAKALGITHENLSYAIESLSNRVERNTETTSINWLPHYHDLGLVDGLLTGIYWGSCTYLMEGSHFVSNPLGWIKALSKYGITYSSAPNFGYDLCVSRFSPEAVGDISLSGVESLLMGGEMVRISTIQRFTELFTPYGLPDRALLPGYGMAETTLAVSCQSRQESTLYMTYENNQIVNCGTVFEGTTARIVDDHGNTVPDGTIGNIELAGRGVARSFQNGRFEHNPVVQTGDLAYVLDSKIYLIGRKGDLMIKNGQNYALSELEEIASTAHPALHPSGLVSLLKQLTDQPESFDIVAEVRRGTWQQTDYTAIGQAIRTALYKSVGLTPDQITLVSYWTIPRTSSGKKQKQLLNAQLQNGALKPLFISA